ncbi:tryptophan-rich sensory protein [Candidatus Pacearchaeota archaeon]|nr:tryptophan-rich sensory protein [Candidatus Pacearchaeota archaeon]
MKIRWKIAGLSLIMVILTAGIGSIFTAGETQSAWYESIKPSITPPNYVFPIAWNILFFLIFLSFYFSLANNKNKKKTFFLFSINFFFNIIWSYLYFKMKNPAYAFIDIILIIASIIYLIAYNWKNSKVSSYLLIPYFL